MQKSKYTNFFKNPQEDDSIPKPFALPHYVEPIDPEEERLRQKKIFELKEQQKKKLENEQKEKSLLSLKKKTMQGAHKNNTQLTYDYDGAVIIIPKVKNKEYIGKESGNSFPQFLSGQSQPGQRIIDTDLYLTNAKKNVSKLSEPMQKIPVAPRIIYQGEVIKQPNISDMINLNPGVTMIYEGVVKSNPLETRPITERTQTNEKIGITKSQFNAMSKENQHYVVENIVQDVAAVAENNYLKNESSNFQYKKYDQVENNYTKSNIEYKNNSGDTVSTKRTKQKIDNLDEYSNQKRISQMDKSSLQIVSKKNYELMFKPDEIVKSSLYNNEGIQQIPENHTQSKDVKKFSSIDSFNMQVLQQSSISREIVKSKKPHIKINHNSASSRKALGVLAKYPRDRSMQMSMNRYNYQSKNIYFYLHAFNKIKP